MVQLQNNVDDTNLKANTTYTYTVKAISNSNEVSDTSNVLTVTTNKKEEGGTETKGRQERSIDLGTFASPQLYTKHEKVVYQRENIEHYEHMLIMVIRFGPLNQQIHYSV